MEMIRNEDMTKAFHEPIVSIIIPVYNAGDSLHLALDSIGNQSYLKLEIIIVNDCSTDDSLKAVERFVPVLEAKGMLTKVVNHSHNQGVAAARNTGLDHASGSYIYYVDADDRIGADAIELLVREAISTNADIIGCNWFLTFDKNERRMNQPALTSSEMAIQKILNGAMRWNLWLFMVRRSLYEQHQIRFTPGMNMGEDLMVMIKLFVHATGVSYVDQALYHYGQSNVQSLTKIYSDAHITEVTANVREVEQYLLKSRFGTHLGDGISFLKLNIKLPLLISDQEKQYKQWLLWFPETNHKVMDNKSLAWRTRFIQWLAVNKIFWALKLYYRLVIRLVYGKLYK